MEAPRLISLHGDGAVSVWFVSWPELRDAIGDDILTVPELKTLTSIDKGTPTVYNEVLLPLQHITMNAEGRLEDGRRFQFHATGTRAGRQVVRIRIW